MIEKMLKIHSFIISNVISNEGDKAVGVGSEGLGSRDMYAGKKT